MATRTDCWLERGEDWAILGIQGPIAEASATGPGARTLAVYEATDTRDLAGQLLPWKRRLSTVSVALTDDEHDLLPMLAQFGVHRTCAPGEMQAPRADRAPDGHLPFGAFVRLTDRV